MSYDISWILRYGPAPPPLLVVDVDVPTPTPTPVPVPPPWLDVVDVPGVLEVELEVWEPNANCEKCCVWTMTSHELLFPEVGVEDNIVTGFVVQLLCEESYTNMSDTGHPLESTVTPDGFFGNCNVIFGALAKLDGLPQLNPTPFVSYEYVTLTNNVSLSLFGSDGFEDGSVFVVFITNQSFSAFPVELEVLFDFIFRSFSPPVEGITELCIGMYIC